MEIEITNKSPEGLKVSGIAEDVRKISDLEYEILFGKHVLTITFKTKEDIESLKEIFYPENPDPNRTIDMDLYCRATNIHFRVDHLGKKLLEGDYEYSELTDKGKYEGGMEISVYTNRHRVDGFFLIFIPGENEELKKMFDKLFIDCKI